MCCTFSSKGAESLQILSAGPIGRLRRAILSLPIPPVFTIFLIRFRKQSAHFYTFVFLFLFQKIGTFTWEILI